MKLKKFLRWPMERPVLAIALALEALGVFAIFSGQYGKGGALLFAGIIIDLGYHAIIVRPARIPKEAILCIRLSGRVPELPPRSLVNRVRASGWLSLYHLRRILHKAAEDPSVAGVLIESAGLEMGFAAASELYDLLSAVRSAGKRVVAVLSGDSVAPREYMVACAAGEIVVNPNTTIMMLGVAVGNVFLKKALENAEIQAQTLQWKEYKGAAETFNRDAMSPQLRESLEAVVHDWAELLAENLAASRQLSLERAHELLGRGFCTAEDAITAGLIDRSGYFEDIRTELDPSGATDHIVGPVRYLRNLNHERRAANPVRIALVHGVGPIVSGEPPPTGETLSAAGMAADIGRAAADRRIRAIVIRINSPGGSAVASDLIWRAIREAQRTGKPVVVSMGDVAASGGYYVAAGADAIVAEPGTITGSIGVVYTRFNFGSLLARIGIGVDYVKSGTVADALSPARALTGVELEQIDAMLGKIYENFTGRVAAGRRLNSEDTERLARGRLWSGRAAHASKLVDDLGGLGRAIEIARAKAGIATAQPHEMIPYPRVGGLWMLQTSATPAASAPGATHLLSRVLGIPKEWIPGLVDLLAERANLLLCPVMFL